MTEYEKDDTDTCKVDDDVGNDTYEGIKSHAKNNIDNYPQKEKEDDEDSSQLNDCGCCQGVEKITPLEITNPPGLSTIKYRVGTHSQFKSSMIVNLQRLDHVRKTTLDNLTTREDDDLTIALLDGWATIADVLTFYQERIANEGFLRTAKERKSIVELARSIGYELRPGVAAGVFLAFTIDAATTADEKIKIPPETKAQSMPSEGKMPQIFETAEEIEAHHEWNELKPRLYQPQNITAETPRFYFKGTSNLLEKGDMLLVIPGKGTKFSTIVSEIEEDPKLDRTIVDVIPPPELQKRSIIKSTTPYDYATRRIRFDQFNLWISSLKIAKTDPNNVTIGQLKELTSYKWTKSDLNAFSAKFALPLKEFFKFINKIAPDLADNDDSTRVFTFRIKAGVFGHNAPKYDALPSGTRGGVGGEARASYEADRKEDRGGDELPTPPDPIYDVEFAPVMRNTERDHNWFDLDNLHDDILPSIEEMESWVVLTSYDVASGSSAHFHDNPHAYRIKNTREGSISRYLVTAKVTSLELLNADVQARPPSDFRVRSTTVHAKSEQLELAELPIDEPIAGNSVTLERVVENELRIGQRVSISGEMLDIENQSTKITSSEIATISNIELDGIYTVLIFDKNLHGRYKRDTVVINANIAKATHGETKEEILGGGDPLQRQQHFYLKQKPLTYVSAPTPKGIKSSLEVRVDGILWKEVPFLYGHSSNDKVYVVRIDDKYEQKIIFGDDVNGMKPPAGMENITSKYRVGIGIDGLVEPENIKLLASRPLGVQSVINPIASSGADNPESLEDARTNATLNVLTLDRIISVRDTENFALAFAGIGKARAFSAVNNGNRSNIHLTIASAFGDIIDKESELYENLSNAIRRYSDPSIVVSIEEFEKMLFNIEAKVAVSEERKLEDVFLEVIQVLIKRFSFESRRFLQPVALSEVVSTIHTVKGVVAVDVDCLYVYGKEKRCNELLPEFSVEDIAAKGNQNMYEPRKKRDWLLTINPDGIKLSKMPL